MTRLFLTVFMDFTRRADYCLDRSGEWPLFLPICFAMLFACLIFSFLPFAYYWSEVTLSLRRIFQSDGVLATCTWSNVT